MGNRLAKEKNCETAIKAVAKCSEDYHLLVIGDGPWRGELEALALKETGAKNKEDITIDLKPFYQEEFSKKYIAGENKKLKAEMDAKSCITFAGMLDNNTLPYFYLGADYFLSCSVSETFGISVVEAIGCDLLPLLAVCDVFAEMYEKSDEITGNMFDIYTPDCLIKILNSQKAQWTAKNARPYCPELIRKKLRTSIF